MFEFGDIVVNHYASESNPQRKGVFVRYCKRGGMNCIELTNMKGEFWYPVNDENAKLEKTGSILDNCYVF
jgi:hypothetical protein